MGPCRCVCRWAAARPRDRHTRACGSEWSISRPALALPPATGTAAGESRETVIAFAGVCSVSGETDDTIAGQIHLFSAQFWRAKASWVSWRRPEVPALVLTVSSRGAVSGMGAIKFAHRHRNQVPKLSIDTEARPSLASLSCSPTKPAVYADRLLRYG